MLQGCSRMCDTKAACKIPKTISQHTPKILFTRDFIFAVFAAFFSAAAIHSLTPTLPIYLTRLGSNQKEIGVLVGIFAVATLVSRLFMGKALLMYREKTVMIFGTLLCILTFLASIVFRPFWPFFIIRVLQGTTLACMDTAVLAFIIGVIPLAYEHGRWATTCLHQVWLWLLPPPLVCSLLTGMASLLFSLPAQVSLSALSS